MKQEAFEARFSTEWDAFEEWVNQLSAGPRRRIDAATRADIGRRFPAAYRQICHHLAQARARRYSLELQHRLNQLALEGHQFLYRSHTAFLGGIVRFVVNDFPAAFRRHWRFMLASALFLYVPALAMGLAVSLQGDLVYSLLEPHEVSNFEDMYDPSRDVLGREREYETNLLMFGHYIYNNISIGFQTFAGGLLFGVGTLFYLIFNGLFFGAVASHLTSVGYVETFWGFVAGHSSFELTAIVIFGGIGLAIGYSAIAPGRKARWHAIRDRAIGGMPLIYGGGLMLVVAAFVEAYWSATTWPPATVKYGVGILFWILHGLYFALFGRNES